MGKCSDNLRSGNDSNIVLRPSVNCALHGRLVTNITRDNCIVEWKEEKMSTTDEDVRKVEAQERAFEKILSYVPGYSGYKQKEIRRETDRLVRQASSINIKKSKDALREPLAYLQMAEEDRIFIDNLLTRIDTVQQKVERAVGGYAGFFDAVKIDEAKLNSVVANDRKILDASMTLFEIIKPLPQSSQTGSSYIAQRKKISEQLAVIEDALDSRNRLLSTLD